MKHVVYNERAGGVIKSNNYTLGLAVTGLLVLGAAVPVANALTTGENDLGDNGQPAMGRGTLQVGTAAPVDLRVGTSESNFADTDMTVASGGAVVARINSNVGNASSGGSNNNGSAAAASVIVDDSGGRGGGEAPVSNPVPIEEPTPTSDTGDSGGTPPDDTGSGSDGGGLVDDVVDTVDDTVGGLTDML